MTVTLTLLSLRRPGSHTRLPFLEPRMDTVTTLLLVLALVLLVVTWQAKRLGNEWRDVALLASVSGMLGAGSVAVAVL